MGIKVKGILLVPSPNSMLKVTLIKRQLLSHFL
jgi:hypothetical protein